MNKERLLILADFLSEKVPSEQFLLDVWVADDGECGTVACACGWAARIPEFAALGFRLHDREIVDGVFDAWPAFGDKEGWDAVEAFFDLIWEEAHYLFASHMYPCNARDTKDVVARIRKFYEEGKCSDS